MHLNSMAGIICPSRNWVATSGKTALFRNSMFSLVMLKYSYKVMCKRVPLDCI